MTNALPIIIVIAVIAGVLAGVGVLVGFIIVERIKKRNYRLTRQSFKQVQENELLERSPFAARHSDEQVQEDEIVEQVLEDELVEQVQEDELVEQVQEDEIVEQVQEDEIDEQVQEDEIVELSPSHKHKLVKMLKLPDLVYGVTYWMGKIYVVCKRSTEIHVYDAKTFYKETSLTVDFLCEPNDIATHNDCLYILDSACIILRYFEPNYKVEKWLTMASKHYRKLSIASDGRLIMICDYPQSIDIYDPALLSSKPETINLIDLHLPHFLRHVIEMDPDRFIVSYGKKSGDDSGILEITRGINGKLFITKQFPVVNTLSVNGREDDASMCTPCHLAKDGAGNIFVANKDRVTVLNRYFEVQDVINYRPSLNKFKPIRLWFHPEEANGTDGLLIVGRRMYWVDVYNVT